MPHSNPSHRFKAGRPARRAPGGRPGACSLRRCSRRAARGGPRLAARRPSARPGTPRAGLGGPQSTSTAVPPNAGRTHELSRSLPQPAGLGRRDAVCARIAHRRLRGRALQGCRRPQRSRKGCASESNENGYTADACRKTAVDIVAAPPPCDTRRARHRPARGRESRRPGGAVWAADGPPAVGNRADT